MSQEGKAFDTTGPWDAGYEVCFYRDLLAANRRLAHEVWVKDKKFYSQKRTFDIALFSPKVIIAIEAKAAQSFDSKQKDSIELDKTRLRSFVSKLFPAVEVPQLFFVALTQERITVPENLFRHQITWASLARECPVIDESCRSVLERAEVVRARFG
jgi:deoxycytidine triphosphate deaminase